MAITREIKTHMLGSRGRPLVLLSPDIGSHYEDLHGWLRHQRCVQPFQPVIKPLQLKPPDGQAGVRTETDVFERDGHVVRPRADHYAIDAAILVQRSEGVQV